MGRFIGVEHELTTENHRKVTPDLAAVYDHDTKGLIFELKWSLPSGSELLKAELLDLKKYSFVRHNWGTSSGTVDYHDLVLICHVDDVKRVVSVIDELVKASAIRPEGLTVWTWTITPPKGGERKEEMRLVPMYGKTRNDEIETMIRAPGGILIPEDVLMYNRFQYNFIRQKPPVQYMMTILIQNIFSSFQQKSERDYYKIKIDLIYERCKAFFPSWREADTETVQIKKKWIREALEMMVELKLIERDTGEADCYLIPIPTLQTREPVHIALCKKLEKLWTRRAKKPSRKGVKVKRVRVEGLPKERPLREFFK